MVGLNYSRIISTESGGGLGKLVRGNSPRAMLTGFSPIFSPAVFPPPPSGGRSSTLALLLSFGYDL